MGTIIDRRKNDNNKSLVNRNKFVKRVSNQIRKNIPRILNGEPIKDIKNGKDIKIPIKGIELPNFRYADNTGKNDEVYPGNKNFDKINAFKEGDSIPKPKGGGKGSGGRKGSPDDIIAEDEFVVSISKDEFLDYFFDDLELPDMTKKFMKSEETWKWKKAGFKKDGNPSNLNLYRSYEKSLARRMAMEMAIQNEIDEKEKEYEINPSDLLLEEIEDLKQQKERIPFFDDVDLRYNNYEKQPEPTTNAVMFCIMDVSASMGYREKDIARRFFTLLYLFLGKNYPKVDIVFIQHHTEAKEVTEEEFFNSRESGGTKIESAFILCNEIIQKRYSKDWNIYVAQASDGDVWGSDDARRTCLLLRDKILPRAQYMAYIEIENAWTKDDSELWKFYQGLMSYEPKLNIKRVADVAGIWPVFKKLFQKKKVLD